MTSGNTYARIYAVVRQIPSGQVATYGQIADLAGLAGKPRLVGYALYRVAAEDYAEIPWQRVINARGEISHSSLRQGTDYLQRSLLEAEGICFNQQGKIDLSVYRWQPVPSPAQPETSSGCSLLFENEETTQNVELRLRTPIPCRDPR
ncbi:MAG: methyltransferase [Spirulinaceae cyanobacterium RM2_2_10]|nr:methyltransferase [Spirulinaceae cyanobacterium SM2_1_0]NJO19544.1 methyltransferase [Spirulinaceae cyanobacterium RM2_2_10]